MLITTLAGGGEDAHPTADDDIPAGALRATVLRARLAPCAGAGRRDDPGAGQAHGLRRPARDGPEPLPALRALPPGAQPREVVEPGGGPRAARAAGGGVRPHRPAGLRLG